MKRDAPKRKPRPPLMFVAVRLPPSVVKRLDELADQVFGTRSTALRALVQRGLRHDHG